MIPLNPHEQSKKQRTTIHIIPHEHGSRVTYCNNSPAMAQTPASYKGGGRGGGGFSRWSDLTASARGSQRELSLFKKAA